MNRSLPPFYVTQTLLGYHPGPDLNRITLNMPNEARFILCELGEPRTDAQLKRWNELAEQLSKMWNTREV